MVLSQYLPEQRGGHSNEDIDIDYCIDICAIIGLSKSHILEEGQDQDNTLDFQNTSILQWELLLASRQYSFSSVSVGGVVWRENIVTSDFICKTHFMGNKVRQGFSPDLSKWDDNFIVIHPSPTESITSLLLICSGLSHVATVTIPMGSITHADWNPSPTEVSRFSTLSQITTWNLTLLYCLVLILIEVSYC